MTVETDTLLRRNCLPCRPLQQLLAGSIVPLLYQPNIAPSIGNVFGLGDIQEQLYLSPRKAGSFIWGAGGVVQLPTATDMAIGSGKWANFHGSPKRGRSASYTNC